MKAPSTFSKHFLFFLSTTFAFLFFLSGCNPSIVNDAASGDYNSVLKSLDEGQDSLAVQDALCMASSKGHLKIVQLLVQKGAKINFCFRQVYPREAPFYWGNFRLPEPAIYYAIENNQLEIVRYLVENGAPVTGNPFINPLRLAVNCGSLQVASYLISKGANANASFPDTVRHISGRIMTIQTDRVIYWAVQKGNDAMVSLLKSKGAQIPKGNAVLIAGNRLSSQGPVYNTRLSSIDGKEGDWGEMAELSPGFHSVVINGGAVQKMATPITINVDCKDGDLIGVHPVSTSDNWNVIVRKY